MDASSERRFLRGVGITSLGTLVSRLFGLLRDIVTASLLGLGQGGVMDALVVALRIPNFSRRVLGEGALATSFLPEFTREHGRRPEDAWRLLTALLIGLAAVTIGLVLVGELVCLAWWRLAGECDSHLFGLTAAMLPYLVFVCLAAQLATALQGVGRFRVPALAPALLNVCWLAAAWLVAPQFNGDRVVQTYVIAAAVLVAGALQCAALIPPLYRAGFRLQFDWRASWPPLRRTLAAMLPIAFGLAVTQINTLVDSLLAVALAGAPNEQFSLGWFGEYHYPLETGAAAAIYYGERFYQLPVGLLGLAIATVIYPMLARSAARGDRQRIGAELTAGLRWALFASIPAGIGLMLVAEPLMQVLFVRGAFSRPDAGRAAAMIGCYAGAAWAYCSLPLLARGFYSIGDRTTPLRMGIIAVAIDIASCLFLIGPLGELGLALSTALAATVQTALLAILLSKAVPLAWRELRSSLARVLVATAAMAFTVQMGSRLLLADALSRSGTMLALLALIAAGAAVYLLVAWTLGARELRTLFGLSSIRTDRIGADENRQAMISRIG
jgi:putative peptidoglycan lipid II flippase